MDRAFVIRELQKLGDELERDDPDLLVYLTKRLRLLRLGPNRNNKLVLNR